MRPSHILWDFNGTILDDVDACIRSINELLVKYGNDPIPDLETYRNVFGFPVKDYYEKVGFDFDKISFDALAVEWVDLYLKYSKPSKLCPNVIPALMAVRSAGIPQLILTASLVDMVEDQLSELGIGDYFDGIIGKDNIHAHGKTDIALSWYEKNRPVRPVMIGDTAHDAEVADAIGAECILVSCGHMSVEKLSALKPVYPDPLRAVMSIL